MPVDIDKLDAEIRRLQMIRELASDPASRALLERFVTPNGHAPPSAGHQAKPKDSESVHESGHVVPKRTYGQMAQHVQILLNATPQSAEDIAKQMLAQGFKFGSDPRTSISDVLRGLEPKGLAKRSGKGKYGVSLWIK